MPASSVNSSTGMPAILLSSRLSASSIPITCSLPRTVSGPVKLVMSPSRILSGGAAATVSASAKGTMPASKATILIIWFSIPRAIGSRCCFRIQERFYDPARRHVAGVDVEVFPENFVFPRVESSLLSLQNDDVLGTRGDASLVEQRRDLRFIREIARNRPDMMARALRGRRDAVNHPVFERVILRLASEGRGFRRDHDVRGGIELDA